MTANDDRQPAMADAANDAYWTMRSAVIKLAAAEGAQVHEKPAWPGALISTTRHAEPLAGIRAAVKLKRITGRAIGDYVRLAREAGTGWQQIGDALGLDDTEDGKRSGYDLAVAAYEYAAGKPGLSWSYVSFGYTCPACGETISDRGPYESHPEDNERGHGEDCSRMAALVEAYQAERDSWDC